MTRTFLPLLLLVLLCCVGCAQPDDSTPAAVTGTPSALPVLAATPEATPTMPQLAATETPTQLVTATQHSPVEETPTLAPLRATQQALADAVRVPTRAATRAAISVDDYAALVEQACQIVQDNYVRDDFNGVDWQAECETYLAQAREIDSQEAYWQLMGDFIAELGDNHSRYVAPGQFAQEFDLPTEGSGRAWPGFVVSRAPEYDNLHVWHVCSVGPAAQAGLQRGDVILAIDGAPVPENRADFNASALLYAEGKREVTLTVQQGAGAAPRVIEIRYGGASGCDGWQYGLLSENPRIGYIRIPDFSGNASANILDLLGLLEEQAPLEGLVLDVRHNPGGNPDQAIAIFTQGTFGYTGPLREDASQTVYRVRGPVRWNETTPVALLIDGASHSAAEYFATALQQSGRATLVGMPTSGNAEGITGFNLADGSLIRLATTTLQLPDGSSLEGSGVQPDVEVPPGEWGLRQQPDVQLRRAFEILTSS